MDKRYIAPIIITILAVIYLLGMAAAFFSALLQGMPFVLFLLLVIGSCRRSRGNRVYVDSKDKRNSRRRRG